jgi:hypothetical protein
MAVNAVQTWVLTALALGDKGVDLAQLLERLKEQLHLLSLLIDRGQGGGTEVQMIAQEHQPAFLLGVEDFHPPGKGLTLSPGRL